MVATSLKPIVNLKKYYEINENNIFRAKYIVEFIFGLDRLYKQVTFNIASTRILLIFLNDFVSKTEVEETDDLSLKVIVFYSKN